MIGRRCLNTSRLRGILIGVAASAVASGTETPGRIGSSARGTAGLGHSDRTLGESDAQLTLSITASLSDQSKRAAVWQVLNDLAAGIDDGEASHIQLSVKVTSAKTWAKEMKDKGERAGMASDVRDI